MRHTFGIPILAFAALLATYGSGHGQSDPREAHGRFTGEIKAVLYVRDVERSARYYRDAMGFGFDGFANKDEEPYYVEMLAGGTKFGLHQPTSPEQEAKVGQQRLYFRVKDLDAHRARVASWGGDVGEVKQRNWMDMFIAHDPDGNEVVFAVTDPKRHSSDPWRVRIGSAERKQEVPMTVERRAAALRGKTLRWAFDDGPTRGTSFEHTFNEDGTVRWRVIEGRGKGRSAQEKEYAAIKVSEDVYAVSYRGASGRTLTVVLNLESMRVVGFASSGKEWHSMAGTFEVVE